MNQLKATSNVLKWSSPYIWQCNRNLAVNCHRIIASRTFHAPSFQVNSSRFSPNPKLLTTHIHQPQLRHKHTGDSLFDSSKATTQVDGSSQSDSSKTPRPMYPSYENPLLTEIVNRIKVSGPITVADYMRMVLTNPITGFYMNDDVFGHKGHFTTSPEISQIFGELVGCWILNEWQRFGCPKPLRIIEYGPGRGTLMADIDRVINQFSLAREAASFHLLEISPYLTQIQERTICGSVSVIPSQYSEKTEPTHTSQTRNGIPITWYRAHEQLSDFGSGFSAFVAHEFFDALPIHKFQRTDRGWREILIDLAGDGGLRYVISKNPTPASTMLIDPKEKSDHLEICPDAPLILNKAMAKINKADGCFLICDYGSDEEELKSRKIRDTFRGFRNHELWSPLKEPGTADLTADVDFAYLKKHAANEACIFGPVSQNQFLGSLGIDMRLSRLLATAPDPAARQNLESGVDMLVREMGMRYKFLALFPKDAAEMFHENPPAGFEV